MTPLDFWIPGTFSEATKGPEGEPLWTEEEEKAFTGLEQALPSAPALALSYIFKPLPLLVDEKKEGVAKGC